MGATYRTFYEGAEDLIDGIRREVLSAFNFVSPFLFSSLSVRS